MCNIIMVNKIIISKTLVFSTHLIQKSIVWLNSNKAVTYNIVPDWRQGKEREELSSGKVLSLMCPVPQAKK